ncbi:MAG: 16S rRNA (uracil(1498)-N(3))-methyltransferase [Candidatus Cloacimonetes bacterium]|nr:16S rRNA (uracil(1498)-N(3))-methyltransferase [Candidatus Cloacimonadota bacterium]
MPSFYYPEIEKGHSVYTVKGEEYHHIIQVLRKRTGDQVLITTGRGILAEAEIQEVTKKELLISVTKITEFKQTHPYMALGFALLKNRHDHLIIEKCTELGCQAFYPVETERTIRKGNDNLSDKLLKVAIAAIKQCDNAWLPEIGECHDLETTLQKMRSDGFLPVVALETGESEHLFTVRESAGDQPLGLIIGPEGGFSEAERKLFELEKVQTITLGNHILRAETAAIAAISLLAGVNHYHNRDYY